MASRGGRDDKLELLRQLPWAEGAGDDDLRWLARVADGFRRPAGATVARRTSPSRWAYVVLAGTVALGDERHGPGAVVLPDVDVVAVADVEVLAFPRTEEPGLHRRFPSLAAAPVPVARPRSHCPAAWSKALDGAVRST
jgi:hypothetical protein